ncbi:hypothetical protein GE061_020278 [Apolygus lucorum]|uniref:CIDE-N domain-containing protein n=1 Tax=Apolygus lucorum TaxID=248454 RepID=A0A6A4IPT7_APOLU|nr:hypothetical protein GE061_020278 [Apolygus lucorum]
MGANYVTDAGRTNIFPVQANSVSELKARAAHQMFGACDTIKCKLVCHMTGRVVDDSEDLENGVYMLLRESEIWVSPTGLDLANLVNLAIITDSRMLPKASFDDLNTEDSNGSKPNTCYPRNIPQPSTPSPLRRTRGKSQAVSATTATLPHHPRPPTPPVPSKRTYKKRTNTVNNNLYNSSQDVLYQQQQTQIQQLQLQVQQYQELVRLQYQNNHGITAAAVLHQPPQQQQHNIDTTSIDYLYLRPASQTVSANGSQVYSNLLLQYINDVLSFHRIQVTTTSATRHSVPFPSIPELPFLPPRALLLAYCDNNAQHGLQLPPQPSTSSSLSM